MAHLRPQTYEHLSGGLKPRNLTIFQISQQTVSRVYKIQISSTRLSLLCHLHGSGPNNPRSSKASLPESCSRSTTQGAGSEPLRVPLRQEVFKPSIRFPRDCRNVSFRKSKKSQISFRVPFYFSEPCSRIVSTTHVLDK